MKASIATVCISGSLEEKLDAAAAAGFDGVELFEPDLVASDLSPEEIRARCERLGLQIDLYQPFRDFEGVTPELLEANLARAEAKFRLMNRMGIDLILVCSNVATATIGDDVIMAEQLRRLGELAQAHGVRVAYEALAWGRFVDDYRHAWRLVELADHPAVGICLDSFHVLSRGHDLADIEKIPGEKIFFVQLADAPDLSLDVLSWSRHHRLFPGEGIFALPDFVAHLLRAGYDGPLSLEVFNDVFRRAETVRTSHEARRSLRWLEDATAREHPDVAERLATLDDTAPVRDVDFVEIRGEGVDQIETALHQLGFTLRGRHATKSVRLWSAGAARVIVAEASGATELAGIGLAVDDAATASRRAHELGAPEVFRRTQRGEQELRGVRAPGGLEVFWNDASDGEPVWAEEFGNGGSAALADATSVRRVDHVNLSLSWQDYDAAVLFHSGVLGLTATAPVEVAGPRGLVRSQVMRTSTGEVRFPLNLAPHGGSEHPQHIAFHTDDIVGLARTARERGLGMLPIGANYYDDLAARFGLDEDHVALLAELDLLYDRDEAGEFWHFYTEAAGRVFLEVVQRQGYDGYGAANAPVRLAAQERRARFGATY